MSDADRDSRTTDWTALTCDQLRAYATALPDRDGELEIIRVVAQSNAYQSKDDPTVCLPWAALALDANKRLHDDGPADRVRMLSNDFALRTWVMKHIGPGPEPAWNPQVLAADTVAALSLDPAEAAAQAAHWRELPIETIRELRRHKNLTTHLEALIDDVSPGPIKERLVAWNAIRNQLP